jgi:hypothetical protein
MEKSDMPSVFGVVGFLAVLGVRPSRSFYPAAALSSGKAGHWSANLVKSGAVYQTSLEVAQTEDLDTRCRWRLSTALFFTVHASELTSKR